MLFLALHLSVFYHICHRGPDEIKGDQLQTGPGRTATKTFQLRGSDILYTGTAWTKGVKYGGEIDGRQVIISTVLESYLQPI